MEALRKGVCGRANPKAKKAGVKTLHAKTLMELSGKTGGANAHIS